MNPPDFSHYWLESRVVHSETYRDRTDNCAPATLLGMGRDLRERWELWAAGAHKPT